MDKERTLHKGNGRKKEKEQELVNIASNDEVLSSIVVSWNLNKPVDIMMAQRMVSIWRTLRKMEKIIEKQGMTVGILPVIQAHPLLAKINDLNAALLSIYKTFAKVTEEKGGPKDFAEWIEQAKKK